MLWKNLIEFQPATVCLLAVVINFLFCSGSRVTAVFAWPSRLAGRMIVTLEERYNTSYATEKNRRVDSMSIAAFLVIVGLLFGAAMEYILPPHWIGGVIEAALLAMVITPRPLLGRLSILRNALGADSLEQARATAALITGRDTAHDDHAALRRVAAETTATGLVQGVIAPLLWFMLGGLPLLAVSKLIDTASIMIDERSENARSFGWAPRCLSAILLLPASWIAAAVFVLAAGLMRGASTVRGLRHVFRRERYAWPVFSPAIRAMAGSLGWGLGGDVCIGGFERQGDRLGPDNPPDSQCPQMAGRLLSIALICLVLLLAGLALLQPGHVLPFV